MKGKWRFQCDPRMLLSPHQQPYNSQPPAAESELLKASRDMGEKDTSQLLIFKFWVVLSSVGYKSTAAQFNSSPPVTPTGVAPLTPVVNTGQIDVFDVFLNL